jgi:KDO2-lipid IV(A) lauroyltransferase
LPAWFVRWAPPLIGAAIAVASPRARGAILRRLARTRGPASPVRDAIDVYRTFASFASCLTEVLATGSKNDRVPEAVVHRDDGVVQLLASSGGIILVTAHTAGWDTLGALLAQEHRKRVMLVMQRERDSGARALHDAAREARRGVQVVHVGGDPLASLPLMRHVREGGVVALQIDRVPRGMAGRAVRLFGRPGLIPEGPLRLAQLTGAPIVPVFSSRTGHRRYAVHLCEPVHVARRAAPAELDAAAQSLADAFGGFVSAHPTDWFAFDE